ncbi:hypothetical protein LB523_05605 [Mesorhizobium sp. ESP-6-4]|uniref:hypothetical protein n=1 Tax=unclassified Mesorhizobium TaxID=325217 RepID=UPI001CCFEAE4|nr:MULTISPECIES: hypothetical protein [unclassified Mesorhizobium]MBZ9658513.1 hypothetical protein [Mesorhizobium sp. ESP-6-4]MBZ9882873.1 hypothetical protein [Mesorhizobium sp. CA10]MBZ9912604.1 hypothetical protein [Mesorhizobium sp. CA16]
MDEQYTVFLIGGGTGGDEQAVFTPHDAGTRCRLTCSYRNKVIAAEEDDYFEALCQIRNQLEVEGLLPFCYGASANVFPEGTVTEMSRGLVVCKVKTGERPKKSDLVNIFDDGYDVMPVFVSMQQKFWDSWLASLPRSQDPEIANSTDGATHSLWQSLTLRFAKMLKSLFPLSGGR